MLIGTWAAAVWAIHFYEMHGFQMVSPQEKDRLLKRYWTIPERQIDTSVVLADPKWWQLSDAKKRQTRAPAETRMHDTPFKNSK